MAQTPAPAPIPKVFFKYNHMSKLFGSCCHRQPNSRDWAKETTPFVWEPAWAAWPEANELSLRPLSVSPCRLSLTKGKEAMEHTQCPLLYTPTSRPLTSKSWRREQMSDISVQQLPSTVRSPSGQQGRIPGRFPCVPRLDTQCTHTRKPGLSPQLLSYYEASVQLPVAYRHEYLEPIKKSLSVCSSWSLPSLVFLLRADLRNQGIL